MTDNFTLTPNEQGYLLQRNDTTIAVFKTEKTAFKAASKLAPIFSSLSVASMREQLQNALAIIQQYGGFIPAR